MNNSLFISVIIPTCHRNNLLSKCLDCLDADIQSISSEQYEVIVTDDGIETTAETMIKENYTWVKWYEGPHKGPAANRNNGVNNAKGEWLVFIDDDCIAEPNLLQEYINVINTSNALAFEGAIHPLGDPNQDLAECPINTEGGCFWSANIAINRDIYIELGGFDENYLVAAQEDQDLKIRLEKFTEIVFVPEAKVFHPVTLLTLHEAISRIPTRTRNWTYHVHKHKLVAKSGGALKYVFKGVKCYSSICLRSLLKGHTKKVFLSLIELFILLPLNWYWIFFKGSINMEK